MDVKGKFIMLSNLNGQNWALTAGAVSAIQWVGGTFLFRQVVHFYSAVYKNGKEQGTDKEMGNEMYEFVKQAAFELGIDTPPLL